jgi:predicted glycoside hydrolase/deacetylase ChbG (UPF0249 family)
MRNLIINGDDFGHSRGVSDGIVEAHAGGILTSTSLMVYEPAAEYAGELARVHPELSVGLHFVEDGSVDLEDPAQVAHAFAAQVARFRELTGRDPSHVDSHHHVHHEEDRMATFERLVAPLGVPLRFDGKVGYVGGFWAQWEPGVTELKYVRRPFLLQLVDTEVPEGWTEIASHPARITGDFESSYLKEREVELATLTEPGLREEIEGRGVKLVSYHDWRRAQV